MSRFKPVDKDRIWYASEACPCRTSPENIPGCEQCECRPADEDKCFECGWEGHRIKPSA